MSRRALLAALLAGLGCTALRLRAGDFEPSVEVEALAVELTSSERGSLVTRFSVKNPTDLEARIVGLRFELFLDGQRFATGLRSLDEALPPGPPRGLDQRLPLALRERLEGASAQGGAEAVFQGALLVRIEGVERGLPFSRRLWLKGAKGLLAPTPATDAL